MNSACFLFRSMAAPARPTISHELVVEALEVRRYADIVSSSLRIRRWSTVPPTVMVSCIPREGYQRQQPPSPAQAPHPPPSSPRAPRVNVGA